MYQIIVADGKPEEWKELKIITNVSVRELKVELERGKLYEFVVTSTNEFGESLKEEDKILRVKASVKGSMCSIYVSFKFRLVQCFAYLTPNESTTATKLDTTRYEKTYCGLDF